MSAAEIVAGLRASAKDAAARHALCTVLARCPKAGAIVSGDAELFARVVDALAGEGGALAALAALRQRLPRCALLGARRA